MASSKRSTRPMRSLCFSLTLTLLVSLVLCAQTPAPAGALESAPDPLKQNSPVQPPPVKPVPELSPEEMEAFLQSAPITARKELKSGTTGTTQARLSDGKLTHDVHIQCLDIYKPSWRGADGTVEKNFRDSWKYNVAAYRLARMLGINTVPMSVERSVDGKQCSVTWWVDNVWIDEEARRAKGIKPPATDDWVNQLNTIRVFDQLIYNMDRNQGNLLITPEWKVWLIDHTRAFRTAPTLMNPGNLRRIDVQLLERLRNLTAEGVKKELGPWLRQEEINALLARRDALVRYFESAVREKGQEAVLTGLPRSTPRVSVP